MLHKLHWIAWCAGIGLMGCVGQKPSGGDTRVALWIAGPSPAHEAVVALAEARVSQLPGVQLLERGEIDRIVAEQGLSAGGFSDSENAVRIGRLLRADLIAQIEWEPVGQSSLGMTVFDARTGARLWDSPLPGAVETSVHAIASAIAGCRAKSALRPDQRRVVCLVAARNAELPRAMDQFCEVTGQLFERELTRNHRVFMLERRRLDALNRERELTGNDPMRDLLASVTLVQIDLNRGADGTGLRGVVTLSDGESRVLDRITVDVSEHDASALAEQLAARVADRLGAASPSLTLDSSQRQREAQRFLHEARARESHRESRAAWRAAEAAHALDPGNVGIEALLARCLLDEGAALLSGQGEIPRDQLLHALEFGLRSVGLRAARLRIAFREGNWKRMNEEELRASATAVSMVRYAELAYRQCRHSPDGTVRRKYARLCEQFLAMDGERFDAWARAAMEQPSLFPLFTHVIQGWHGLTVRYMDFPPEQFVTRLDGYLRRWLEAGNAHPPTVDHAHRISQLFERLSWILNPSPFFPAANVSTNDAIGPEHLQALTPIAGALAASPSIVIGEQGRKLTEHLEEWTRGVKIDPREAEFEREQACIDEIANPMARLDSYRGLIDGMVSRKYVYSPTVEAAAKLVTTHRLPDASFAVSLDQIAAAADNPDFAFSRVGLERQSLKRFLAEHKLAMARLQDIANNGANVPWAAPVQLLNLDRLAQADLLTRIVVADDAVYGVGLQSREARESTRMGQGELVVSVFRAPFASGAASVVGQTTLSLPYVPRLLPSVQLAMADSHLYALLDVQSDVPSRYQLLSFALDGNVVARIDERFDLPAREINSFAVHDGTIYLGLPGYIVACDLASKRVSVLASSRRADKQSELDGGDVFRTWFMIPDRTRNRIVLVVEPHQRPVELWSLEPSTGRLKQFHVASSRLHFTRMDRSGEDRVVFSNGCQVHALHLDTDKLERLAVDSFCGGRTDEKLPLGRLAEREWAVGPHLIHKGWFWSANAFGRISLADATAERFPPVSPPDPESPFHLDPDGIGGLATTRDGKALILATSRGIWLLPWRDSATTR